uniref:Phosphatidylinositol-binding clathrin assembly protein LAP n=1 Tax=Aceria tosichella TaxID=561515 RepID=A0A6G1SFD5_9ACAR
MAATGQTINDRLNAVRYALAGQGLARTVCKATTEEVLGPKKKHIDYLLACTDEPNVSIPQLANLLIDRSQHTSWTVVFKSLITIHHLLNYGNERFTQYLATSNHSFELNDFMDRTTPQGYGMSTFVRRYAKYINNKIGSYKALAIDLCKIKPGKDNGLRTMNMENLCKTLPVVHNQFDSLLDFGAEAKDLNNGIIMAAFRLLYKDLNRIFVAYQEAIINLVERYFKLSRKKTREALNMYKKYLDRLDKVANFFKIVEQVGLDKNEMPDTSKLTSLLSVLEEHMAQLEAKKRGTNVASPDADDDGDDPVTPNKEMQALAISKSEQANKQQLEAAESGGSSAGGGGVAASQKRTTPEPSPAVATSSVAANTSGEPPKKAPPPPARPSPVKLPKASPQQAEPPKSAAGLQESEKKASPERPAKPPSRPPPPSAGTATSQTSTTVTAPPPPPTTTQQTTTASSQAQPSLRRDSGPAAGEPAAGANNKDQAKATTGPAAVATSPSGPSSASCSSQAAQETSQTTQEGNSEQMPATTANAAHQANGSGSGSQVDEAGAVDHTNESAAAAAVADGGRRASLDTNGDGADGGSGDSNRGGAGAGASALPSCSNTVTVDQVVIQDQDQEQVNGENAGDQGEPVETNHVATINNVANHNDAIPGDEIEPPPPSPPPPIEE